MRSLVDFEDSPADTWQVVNDGVMGGLSRARFSVDESTATFEGDVSLENGGGFASVRTRLEPVDLSRWDGIALRVEGGGKTFHLRLRTDDESDGIAYRASFVAPAGEARQVRVPFSAFEPTWRGRVPEGAPPLDPSRIEQIGFLISDEQAGPFRLQVEWIRAYRGPSTVPTP